jgi:hypothetical protein
MIQQTNLSSDVRYEYVQMNALPCLKPEYQNMIKSLSNAYSTMSVESISRSHALFI